MSIMETKRETNVKEQLTILSCNLLADKENPFEFSVPEGLDSAISNEITNISGDAIIRNLLSEDLAKKFGEVSELKGVLKKNISEIIAKHMVAKTDADKYFSEHDMKCKRKFTIQSLTTDTLPKFIEGIDSPEFFMKWRARYFEQFTDVRIENIYCYVMDTLFVRAFQSWYLNTNNSNKIIIDHLKNNGSTFNENVMGVIKTLDAFLREDPDVIALYEFNKIWFQSEIFTKYWINLSETFAIISNTQLDITETDQQTVILLNMKKNKIKNPKICVMKNKELFDINKIVSVYIEYNGCPLIFCAVHSDSDGKNALSHVKYCMSYSNLMPIIVCGDFNTTDDPKKIKNGACSTKHFKDLCINLGLHSFFDPVIYVTTNTKRTLLQPQLHKAGILDKCCKDGMICNDLYLKNFSITNLKIIGSYDGSCDINNTLPNKDWRSDHYAILMR